MATTSRANKFQKLALNRSYMGMGLATIILASILSLLFVVSLFARPTIVIAHGKILYLDGIIASAIILGAMVWALIEALTPPGGIVSLIWRAGLGIIIGGAAGAYVGYSFDFSQYIIIPLYHGNFYAQAYAFCILIFGFAVIWDAAWSHRHGYLGQKAKNAKKAGYKESGRAKGYRKMIGLILGLIFVFLMIPASGYVGTAISSLNDHNGLSFPVTSFTGTSPSGNVSTSSFTNFASGTELVTNTSLSSSYSSPSLPKYFTGYFRGYLPTYVSKNATGANVTNYIQTFYISTNLTIGELSSNVYQNIYLSMGYPGEYNISLGTGNASTFMPIASLDQNQTMNITYDFRGGSSTLAVAYPSTTASPDGGIIISRSPPETLASYNFAISPSMLTGNQSHKITFEVQTHNQTEFGMYYFAVGATSPTLAGPIQLEDVGYVIGSVLTIVAASLEIPWIDLRPLPGVRKRRSRA